MGVRTSDITRWERGDSLPPAAQVRAAARVLGVSAETARSWLEEVGEAPRPSAEISVRILPGESPADPFVSITLPKVAPTAPAPPIDPDVLRRARDSASGVVFPGYAPAVVYSTEPLPAEPVRANIGRVSRTVAALAALAALLWWAMGQLGSGMSALFDLFGGPPDPGPLGG